MAEENRRHREVEEKLIQATEWIFQTRYEASQRGELHKLRELPQILRTDYVAAKAEEEPDIGPYTQVAAFLQQVSEQMERRDGSG